MRPIRAVRKGRNIYIVKFYRSASSILQQSLKKGLYTVFNKKHHTPINYIITISSDLMVCPIYIPVFYAG
jgi:hypothetical protein